ncbi:MAG: RHS repeat-associated core domain-containing protein [Desulfovibrio sp.]|nr:RHS repeat-associated core domain-containing protein [Desulfovibrio sp.]
MLAQFVPGILLGAQTPGTSMPSPFLSLRRDAQNPRRGRIAERILNLGGEAETRRYTYDSAGRLARVTDGANCLLESYQYDRDGRRLADINPQRFRGERRFTYSLGDRLGQAGRVQYGHDKAGFRNLKIEGGRKTLYHYEPSGLLLAVDLPDDRRIDYAYDAKGQRTEKRVNGRVVEAYQWLDPLRLEEFFDGQRWWRLAYLEDRTAVGVTDGEVSYLFATDQLGTPVALADLDGNIVQTMRYDAFGNLLATRGSALRLPIGFAGGLFDADTGLTRAHSITGWRDYDADTGRFTALDPVGAKGGDKDWYGYCVDAPVNRVDAWGLEDSWWDGSGGKIVKSGLIGAGTGAYSGFQWGTPLGVPWAGAAAGAVIGSGTGMLKQTILEYPLVGERLEDLKEQAQQKATEIWNEIPESARNALESMRSLEDYSTE